MKKINALLKNDSFVFALAVVLCLVAITTGLFIQMLSVGVTAYRVLLLFVPGFMTVVSFEILQLTAKEVLNDLK